MAASGSDPGDGGAPVTAGRPGRLARLFGSDLFYSFRRSPLVVIAALITVTYFLGAGLAQWVAPHDPFNPATLNLMDAFTPPAWTAEGQATFALGTDDQGRDLLSAIMYGTRISLVVGFAAILFAVVLGVGLGVIAGYVGGFFETMVMRAADVQLTIPGILVALMVNGAARAALPSYAVDDLAIYVLIFAIGISDWPQFARVTRSATMVEKNREYVAAAQVIGVHPMVIMFRHVLPNVMGPVLVLATIGLALAIIAEATLSFLGVGVPPTTPSLGTLIRVGNDFLFSGEWWITLFPALALVLLVLSVNLLGDWLRDALNPKLR
ncbi:peptide/nickel transport system permease protein [Constrictibacter sp. MBR-5]|jgi:peptide/nickel transport system permease protein|uniref:ABC transporter permease n=1 Tax=Constrictibacter sp. MBR-5 TaxID=3156467 RepID=UPI003397B599